MAISFKNSLVAICIALYFKIKIEDIYFSLKNYEGVKRRFEIIKESPLVIHDYAHHPTEIKKTVELAKKINRGRLYVVFQPHTYSRTLTLKKQFIKVLSNCGKLYLIKTYSAREKFCYEGSSKALSDVLPNSVYFNSMEKAYDRLKKHLKQEDTLLILGAGDIDKLAYMFSR